jgi:Na+/melibiose symporter-like transporter
MWFVYLSWYLKEVIGLDDNIVAAATLSGQIADGITTPIVGVLSDKIKTRCGSRIPWYIFGTLFVIPCFMGIFTDPTFILDNLSEGGRNAWYITLPGLFNVGWAAVQISHMAIVNDLSYSNRMRDRLVNNRNGFTYAANITVLTTALVLFNVVPEAKNQFRFLCLIA